MIVKIEQDECIECGACEQNCSKLFIVESGQKASIVEKYRKNTSSIGEVPDALVSCANEAVIACPVQVISIE